MPRSRSRVIRDDVSGPYNWQQSYYGGPFETVGVTSYHNLVTKDIVDVVTPGYYGLSKSGAFLPINSCTISTVEDVLSSPHSGSMHIKEGDSYVFQGSHVYDLAVASIAAVVPDQAEIDNVVIKALSNAKTADWDVLTFLGELHDTVRLVEDTFRRVDSIATGAAWKAFRREFNRSRRHKRPYSVVRATDEFNRFWLEARYGWRPLLYDVQSALKALRHKTRNSLARKTATTTLSLKKEGDTGVFDNGNVKYTAKVSRVGTIKYRAVVFYNDNMGPIGVNPVVTAWELTRFSFVIDWFFNVGNWLQAISPREGFEGLGTSVSVTIDCSDRYTTSVEEGYQHNYSVSLTDKVRIHNVKSYSRSAYTGIPLPHIDVHLNPLKIVDLFALIVSNRGKIAAILSGRK